MKKPDLKKRCFAPGCSTLIPTKLLMCLPHWNTVPAAVQREVYRTLREWTAGGSSRSYVLATYRAQLAAAEADNLSQGLIEAIRQVIAGLEAKEAQ
jgi:hypothetical protein